MKKRNKKVLVCLLASAAAVCSTIPAMAAETDSYTAALLDPLSLLLLVGEESNDLGNILLETLDETEEETTQSTDTEEEDTQEETGEETQEDCSNIGVAQVSDYLNIRSEPSTSSEVVGIMQNNTVAYVESEEDGWYQITSGDISGYVCADYLVVGDWELVESVKLTVAVVEGTGVRIRSEASTDSAVLTQVTTGDTLEVLDESLDGWVMVEYDGEEAYLCADYVSVEDTYLYAEEPEESSEADSTGSSVAAYAVQFVGNPYKWGGSSLTNGADCSGFVMAVYAHFGVSLPHSSSALRSVGTEVSYSEAQPGDIICYEGHVALYIGNGQIVHASNEKNGIMISSATYKSILTVRRIFN